MRLLAPIKDHHSERRLFVARVAMTSSMAILLLGVVVARLVQLQVINYELFAEQSQGNRYRIEAVPPTRGLIYDRKGRVLAENLPAYQLEMIPEQVADLDDTLLRLAAMQLIATEDIDNFKELARSGPRFKPVTLKLRLTDEEIANFAIQRPRFQGVDFQPRLIRHYPHGPAVAHAVGYVGALSKEDLQRLGGSAYAGTAHTGKTGIESRYEEQLHGEVGYDNVVTNALGRQVPSDSRDLTEALPANQAPAPGDDLYLSLDLDLQLVASKALENKRGAVVAIDPWSGEILALVSTPSFDPNLFAVGMNTAQYAELQDNLTRPLFNRAIRGAYPPGSTIKPMLALAALESGATNLQHTTLCRGYFTLPNSTHRYRDWRPEGHGRVDLLEALTQSCDVYFYEISNDIGIDNMHRYLDMFGLGHATGIDISGEHEGLVPSTEWKQRTFSDYDRKWYPGETVIASIGQGYMLATPLQLASAIATVATRGTRYQPHLVAASENTLTGERTMYPPLKLADIRLNDEQSWDVAIEGMHAVMQGARGTARAAGANAKYEMAGKSGTAQVFSVAQDEEYDEELIDELLRDHALFVAFAPLENPRIAVAVIVENGSSGSRVAAPIARQLMDTYLGYGVHGTQ
ncbi:MAG: penicillin-binding protein 2 [Gammaproteobacteria bacterium]|nr:penicillin-binding protein 2 [Gammaproteobacteria bacterium]MDH5302815.1 penicillin-binding protein 2 [Gammaproteobacteria bacterium]MDH5321648.1 penicillin-binding protein 2 [Gammaproteobacteria bacterium]